MTQTKENPEQFKSLGELCKESPAFKTLLIGCFNGRIGYSYKTGEIDKTDAGIELHRSTMRKVK